MKKTSKPGRLAVIATERGVTVAELVQTALNQAGSIMGAAMLLGVNPNTIRWHKDRLPEVANEPRN